MDSGSLQDGLKNLKIQLVGLDGLRDGLNGEMNGLAESMKQLGLDKREMKIEIDQTMQQTRKAIQDALRHSQDGQKTERELRLVSKQLSELAGSGVDLGKDTTVVVKNEGKTAKTIVKTDGSGSYVIVADPHKHLTARDSDGKLLFEGAIESPEQQQKVPKEVWEKVKPLVEQMDKEKMEVQEPVPDKDSPESKKP